MQSDLTVSMESPKFRAGTLILPILKKTNFQAVRTRYQRTINIARYSTRGTGSRRAGFPAVREIREFREKSGNLKWVENVRELSGNLLKIDQNQGNVRENDKVSGK